MGPTGAPDGQNPPVAPDECPSVHGQIAGVNIPPPETESAAAPTDQFSPISTQKKTDDHANKDRKSKQKLSLNSLLYEGTAKLPSIKYIHMVQDLCKYAVFDISDAYMRVFIDEEGAKQIQFFAYKTKDGHPTFTEADSEDGRLHKAYYKSSRYGLQDSPQAYQIALEKSSGDFKKSRIS